MANGQQLCFSDEEKPSERSVQPGGTVDLNEGGCLWLHPAGSVMVKAWHPKVPIVDRTMKRIASSGDEIEGLAATTSWNITQAMSIPVPAKSCGSPG